MTSPGWNAIDQALEALYPDVEPKHYGTVVTFALGGPDPLDGISFYPRADHWHVVTFGMSELYDKESDNPDESGWGFEFTFRVGRDPADETPPAWPANFLQNLARYVFQTGNWFEAGHDMDLNGPIALEQDTLIRAITFVEDPELGGIDTPHGRLQFLQVVGLTLDEYAAGRSWSGAEVLALIAARNPLLITDLGRASITDDPAVEAAVEAGRRRDGSSSGSLIVNSFAWSLSDGRVTLTVGAHVAGKLAGGLQGRLPFGRLMEISGPDGGVRFGPSESALTVAEAGPNWLAIGLPPAVLDDLLAALAPRAGTFEVAGMTVEVTRSEIRDQAGNVILTVG